MRMKKNFLKFLLSATVGITSVALVAGCGDSNTVLVNPLATYVQTVSTNLDESEKKVTIGASD
jgi:outer membrane murein-binding lipoprotein Lpp